MYEQDIKAKRHV